MFVKNSTAATIILRGIEMPPNTVAEYPDEMRYDRFFVAFVDQHHLRYVEGPATVTKDGPVVVAPVKPKRSRKQ